MRHLKKFLFFFIKKETYFTFFIIGAFVILPTPILSNAGIEIPENFLRVSMYLAIAGAGGLIPQAIIAIGEGYMLSRSIHRSLFR